MTDSVSFRQREILYFIAEFWTDKGFSPTLREIMTGVYISSTSVVSYNLDELEAQGFIKRTEGISRSIVPDWERMEDVIELAEA
jgi:repressor LexA